MIKTNRYLGNEEQGQGHSDGDMSVCKWEQQHPVRMQRDEGESGGDRERWFKSVILPFSLYSH